MIVAHNNIPTLGEFDALMKATDRLLNEEAKLNSNHFINHNGTALEEDVYEALNECAKNTAFENEIELVSGARFPDIIAKGVYGVEVKSTKKNHWVSIGSSILESTRAQDIQRIYMTFGKLAKPVQFKSRPYEQCLSGIAVTHSPRYKIDMTLGEEGNIFRKMGISYDDFRNETDPIKVFTSYYRKHLKKGQSLWWTAGAESDNVVGNKVAMWKTLSSEEKNHYIALAFAYFPEIFSNRSDKYEKLSLWLTTQGVVLPNVRDVFSAGGKATVVIDGHKHTLPAVYGRLLSNGSQLKNILKKCDREILRQHWEYPVHIKDPLACWIQIVSQYIKDKVDTPTAKELVSELISGNAIHKND